MTFFTTKCFERETLRLKFSLLTWRGLPASEEEEGQNQPCVEGRTLVGVEISSLPSRKVFPITAKPHPTLIRR